MKIITLDFETFYGDDYTLSKMTTESYIRDPRFEAHGCAIKFTPHTPAVWFSQAELPATFEEIDWANTFCISHHAQFDHFILNHHYGVRPKISGCTLSMARLLIGNHLSVSLEAVRKHFGMPSKVTPYGLFKGKRWSEIHPSVREQIAAGACDEVESIWQMFGLLLKEFPREELAVVDATIKMFTQPCLRANIDKLATLWESENTRKEQRLQELGVTKADLQSADRFAELLRAEGIEPPRKTTEKGEAYAFAKNDAFMRELQEDEDERVRTLVEARLSVKSTLLQTRAATFGWMARRGPCPVYLRYAGAHTSRFSGGDNANWQNGVPALNAAIEPPEGYWAAKPDASQIECRILNFVAGQADKIDDFRLGRDPYVGVAEAFCGHAVTKESHPELRQMGKVVELQAGYGSGADKIRATIRNKANIVITSDDADRFKTAYRSTHPKVVALWKEAGDLLKIIAHGGYHEWGVVTINDHRIFLPNGIPLIYEALQWHIPSGDDEIKNQYDARGYWRLRTRDGWSKMYGAKLVENLIQALARVVVTQAMIRLVPRGVRVVNMRHDDLWLVIPKDERAQGTLDMCLDEMRKEPAWLPGIPLDAEGALLLNYGK